MPTNFNNTSSYAGEFAGKYIGAALLSANTIENGGVTVMPNVKYRSTVKALTTQTDFIKNDSCDFDPTGDVVLGDRVIEPKYLQINATVCKKEFEDDWEAIQMGYSAFDVLPKNFTDFFIARLLGSMAESTEVSLWTGDSAVNGQFDGLFSLALSEVGTGIPLAQGVGGTTIDPTNVIAEIGKVVDALPSRLYGKEGLKIYAPQNVVRAYVRALGGFASGVGAAGINNQGTTWYNGNANALTFDGIPLFMANGMDSNTMLASTKENLFFGTGLLSDHQECRIIDMSAIDGSKNVRFVARYTAGTQIGILEDCVVYDVSL
jgi:hypothetical protein